MPSGVSWAAFFVVVSTLGSLSVISKSKQAIMTSEHKVI